MGKFIVGSNYVDHDGKVLGPVETGKADISKLTKAELVALAQDKGLETDGTKDELIARLEAAEQA